MGMDPHPMAHFASSVKVNWTIDSSKLSDYTRAVERSFETMPFGIDVPSQLGFDGHGFVSDSIAGQLGQDVAKLLIKNSISPEPARKVQALLLKIDEHGGADLSQYGRLALAHSLVNEVSNLKFGPEVGVGIVKTDAPVVSSWSQRMDCMANDVHAVRRLSEVQAEVINCDARNGGQFLKPNSVDAVITSPPYPNEKDYTRTTRLESVLLGLISSRQELRQVKENLLRSNTRGVYKSDDDDQAVVKFKNIADIADAIERRRVELGKTSGFERLYSRVTQLYFGGMFKHLSSLRGALRPGAKLAYVVGDQASYLRVMIPTGQILADMAESLGYRVTGIDLFRTRFSTATGDHLREEVIVMEWPHD